MAEGANDEQIVRRLRAAGCVFAEEEAALLIAEAAFGDALEAMIERRVGGEPLEYILGWAEFAGLRIVVAPGVFVPRHRTEYLARLAIELAAASAAPVVLDLCCGAGAIGAAIVAAAPDVELYAADIDEAAVACARHNLPTAAGVYAGDLFEPLPRVLRGRVTVLVANTPYVPTEAIALMPPEARLYELPQTLDGGVDGLDIQRRVAASARDWLAPGGSLLVEASDEQSAITSAIFEAAGMSARIDYDDEYETTVVIGTQPL
jgi:release factor glutamine methyltransferase